MKKPVTALFFDTCHGLCGLATLKMVLMQIDIFFIRRRELFERNSGCLILIH